MLSFKFLLALVSVAFVVAQTPAPTPEPWSGCVDPNNPDVPEQLKIGTRHTICLTIGPGGNWAAGVSYVRYAFQPKADEYSRFHIPKTYKQLVQNKTIAPLDGNLTIHTAAQDHLSFLRVYFDPIDSRVFPFLTAIVDVKDGQVQGIAWDDACVFCSKNKCIENMYNFDGQLASELNINSPSKGCYFTEEECNKIHAEGGTDCDITLYVVWTGTDIDGKSFQSSGNRFSVFPSARLQDRLLNLLPSFPDIGF